MINQTNNHDHDDNSLSQQLQKQSKMQQDEPDSLIQEQLPGASQIIDYSQKTIDIYQKISTLNQQQQLLKQSLKLKEKQLLDIFMLLDQRKRYMKQLVTRQVSRPQLNFRGDIALQQQFEMIREKLRQQKRQIQQLKAQSQSQGIFSFYSLGISGRNNDQQFIKVHHKIHQMQRQIQVGRKFASTQYVRDYIQKPQAFKVSYEQVKYEYEIRGRIKEALEIERQNYLKRKQQLNKQIIRQKQIEQQLMQQKDLLQKQLKNL